MVLLLILVVLLSVLVFQCTVYSLKLIVRGILHIAKVNSMYFQEL